MHKPLNFSTTALDESASQSIADSGVAEPKQPGLAFAAILLGYPVVVVAVVGLLMASRPLLETVLIVFGLQVLAFAAVLVIGLPRSKSAALPATTESKIVLPATDVADIWRTYPASGQGETSLRIALISRDMAQSRNIATNLAGLGQEVHHSTDSDAMLETVQAQPTRWGMVIFDLDSSPDLETGVDDLMEFRGICPKVPVLLLSGDALRNDHSSHRRLIGDATLRKPVFRTHLLEGMEAANLNSSAVH